MYLILTISDGAFSVEGNIHDVKIIIMFIFYSEVKLNILKEFAKMPFWKYYKEKLKKYSHNSLLLMTNFPAYTPYSAFSHISQLLI